MLTPRGRRTAGIYGSGVPIEIDVGLTVTFTAVSLAGWLLLLAAMGRGFRVS